MNPIEFRNCKMKSFLKTPARPKQDLVATDINLKEIGHIEIVIKSLFSRPLTKGRGWS